jgi:hypothetical protein
MPSIGYWIRHYLLAAGSMFLLLLVVDIIKGRNWQESWLNPLAWAVCAAAIFIGSRYHKARKGIACQVCETVAPEKKD